MPDPKKPAEGKPRRMLGTQFIRFTAIGDTFTGKLASKRLQTLNDKECGLYDFYAEGNRCRMNGTDQIDDAMADAEIGDFLKITFMEEVPTMSGFKVRRFEVELLDRPETVEGG